MHRLRTPTSWVTTHSAISVVNALATGKGATIGIGIQCNVKASIVQGKGSARIRSGAPDQHGLVKKCVEYSLNEIGVVLPANQTLEISIDSNIPPAVGLKSSSAVSVAVVKAIFDFFNAEKNHETILNVSCLASKDSGASLTGAYDDASACLLGGFVVTDNEKFKIIKRTSLPRRLGSNVEILVPNRKKYTSSIDRSVYAKMRHHSLRAFGHAKSGDIAQAMFLNSIVQCVALGYSIDPVVIALLEGASGCGITGKGPAIAAICPNATIAKKIRKKWSALCSDCRVISTFVVQPK